MGAREAILALDIQDPGVPKLKNMVRRWGRRVRTWGGWCLLGGGCCRCSELACPRMTRCPSAVSSKRRESAAPATLYLVRRADKKYHSGLTTCWYHASRWNNINLLKWLIRKSLTQDRNMNSNYINNMIATHWWKSLKLLY